MERAGRLPRGGPRLHRRTKVATQLNSMAKLITKLKHEFLAMLPPTIFFFTALHIVSVVRSLMLRDHGPSISRRSSATSTVPPATAAYGIPSQEKSV